VGREIILYLPLYRVKPVGYSYFGYQSVFPFCSTGGSPQAELNARRLTPAVGLGPLVFVNTSNAQGSEHLNHTDEEATQHDTIPISSRITFSSRDFQGAQAPSHVENTEESRARGRALHRYPWPRIVDGVYSTGKTWILHG
jgi:hypothetical protein